MIFFLFLYFSVLKSERTECEKRDGGFTWWLEKCPGVGITGDNVIFSTECINKHNYDILMSHMSSDIYSIAKISERKRVTIV